MEQLDSNQKSSTEDKRFHIIAQFNDNGKSLQTLIEELLIESISD